MFTFSTTDKKRVDVILGLFVRQLLPSVRYRQLLLGQVLYLRAAAVITESAEAAKCNTRLNTLFPVGHYFLKERAICFNSLD